MEFVLYYRGPLQSNGDKKEKHAIRMLFAPQVKLLWGQDPLKTLWETKYSKDRSRFKKTIGTHQYVPLISKYLKLAAKLEITFLRREAPGRIIQGGDIDNRLKTLFDALRMPIEINEIVEIDSDPKAEPIFCVLEDDSLITSVSVNTHQLLQSDHDSDVVLLIKVNTVTQSLTYDNMGI